MSELPEVSSPPPPPAIGHSIIVAGQHPTTWRTRRAQRKLAESGTIEVQRRAMQVAVTEASAELKMGAVDRLMDNAVVRAVDSTRKAAIAFEMAPEAIHEIGDLQMTRQLARRAILSRAADELMG